MKKRKQIKASVLAILMIAVLFIGCSKDDDTQPQTETENPTAEVDKAPEISSQTFTVKEDIADDVVIGSVVASDPESKALTFVLTQNSNDLFELTDAGELSLVADKKLDFETVTSHTLTAEVSNGKNKVSANITVTVENVAEPFVTTWKTTMANEEIYVRIDNDFTYDYTIDWGDGTIENNQTTTPRHDYKEAGVYTVSISGTFPAFGLVESSNALKLQTIEQWGDIIWESFINAFAQCENMTYNATDVPNLSKVTDMSAMFSVATSFNGDLSAWDVSNVTSMYLMFNGAIAFNGDLSAWDVSKVTNMKRMFDGAIAFNGDLSKWDVSKVTDMEDMFYRANVFTGDLSAWDVSKVTNMNSMFQNARSFNRDLSTWDVSKVTNMEDMFAEAHAFNGDISSWDVSKVTNMNTMFYGANSFTGDISSWDVSNVTSMGGMFYGANSFNGDISSWDVSKVTNMNSMFKLATSFNRDLSSWDVQNVQYMDNMLDYTSLSEDNYDALLTKWATLPNLQSNVTFGVKELTYCDAFEAREALRRDKDWIIVGDSSSCPLPL
ncbi:surface protein [Aquimarina sp. MAR_2010_214]|uniref:BspA family leucine-rich repeat surface protein n=1 Tax=Aquimarina sp. MAR_2010_214 TaxID=1250026 RepID=UPI000C70C7AD|nr:BspA family leucine-rich repeat surface protein [Aquimarina sp. MAR_2010_214]PKV51591.1 surface protein [Aquimarina sp. MAR_2010_214]